jgi:hypothetical protein
MEAGPWKVVLKVVIKAWVGSHPVSLSAPDVKCNYLLAPELDFDM